MSKESYYHVLGLEPGAPAQEVKTAYRDLAKVWHPDRFVHDPKLQRKAQEKLKEINEAYEAINSPSPRRTRPRPPRAVPCDDHTHGPRTHHTHPPRMEGAPPAVRNRPGAPRLVPYVAFATIVIAGTFFASHRLFRPKEAALDGARAQAPIQTGEERQAEETAPANRRESKTPGRQRASESSSAADVNGAAVTERASAGARAESAAPSRPLPTVNRTIDPTTGMLAARACPVKSLVTYPSGQEPQQYCNADHRRKGAAESQRAESGQTQPAGTQPRAESKSRIKSVINAVTSPGKWFRRKKEKPVGQEKETTGQG